MKAKAFIFKSACNFCLYADGCFRLADVWRGQKNAGDSKMRFLRAHKEDLAGDAASGIPAGIGLPAVVDAHQHSVFALPDICRQLCFKGRIAVDMAAQMHAVQPYIAVHVNALKAKDIALVRFPVQKKDTSIPADARPRIAA